MLVSQIFHVAIKTADLGATIAFYTRVLGLVLHRRPAFDFQGAWLAPAVAGAEAILHVYAGDAARAADGTYQSGTAVIDHLSLNAQGYRETRDRFLELGLPYRENVVPGLPFWQLFVYDPNGVMLELTYHAAAEGGEPPQIPPHLQYRPREVFFAPEMYAQFVAMREEA